LSGERIELFLVFLGPYRIEKLLKEGDRAKKTENNPLFPPASLPRKDFTHYIVH